MELKDVLDQINKHRSRILEQDLWHNTNELLYEGGQLITYNGYLAELIAPAHKQSTDKAHAIYLEVISKGEGVTKAEQMAKGETTEERRHYEHLKFVYTATSSLVSYIQTVVRVNEQQLKQEVSH